MQKDRERERGVGERGDEKGRVKVVLPFHQPSRRQTDPLMRPLSRHVIFRQQRLFVFSERDKNGSDDIVENRVFGVGGIYGTRGLFVSVFVFVFVVALTNIHSF